MTFDVLILGGGAAALMCAIEAGKRNRRVAILDRADRLGKKILISGGGRCNFTNLHCQPENFLSANPHFAKSALACFAPADFIALVEKHRIPYHEKTLGQLFCDRSARDILAMLEEECRAAEVQMFLNTQISQVTSVSREREIGKGTTSSRADSSHHTQGLQPLRPAADFVVRAATADFLAPALVVATGGLSIPKIGATSFGYTLARQFGLNILDPYPALVPFLLNDSDRTRYCDLAGVSTEVIASCNGHHFREQMLITHRGLSGPAILQISSYWKNSQPIQVDLVPDHEITALFRNPKAPRTLLTLQAELRKILPARLADRLLEINPPASFTNQALADFERKLHHWEITPTGTEGFDKAEVTAGGVDTDELSAKTMESRKVPGLYFIGEVVDVTGHLGGFNFQWAWSSGAAAGRAV